MTGVGWRPLGPPRRPPEGPGPSAFSRLAITHALSAAGDSLVAIALAGSLFFDISPGAARGRVALSLVLTMAPFAVVAPLLGPAIDRSRRGRKTMVTVACVGRAVAVLSMARVIDGLLLFPAAFTTLVLSKGYAVARSSLVPSAVDSDHELVEANAKLAIGSGLAGFLAAVPGVALLRLADARWTLWLAAAVFIAAAVASVRIIERPRVDEPGAVAPGHERDATLSILAAAVGMAVLRAVVGFLTFLVAFGFRRSDAPSWWFGVVLAASVMGSLVAGVLAPRLRARVSEETALAGALGFVGAVAFAVALADGRLWAAPIALAVGLGAGVAKLAFDSLVQRDAPDAVRGRSFARFESGFQLVWVVGALLPVAVATPLRQGFVAIGLATITALGAYVVATRRLGRMASA